MRGSTRQAECGTHAGGLAGDHTAVNERTARIKRVDQPRFGAVGWIVVQRVHQQRGQRADQESATRIHGGWTADERAVGAVGWETLLVSRDRAREIVATDRSVSIVGIVQKLLELVPNRRGLFQGEGRSLRLEKELRRQEADRSVADYVAPATRRFC